MTGTAGATDAPDAPGTPGEGEASLWLPRERMDALLGALRHDGYRVLAPVIRDGASALEEVRESAELARGWRDVQEPGSVRLERGASPRCFGVVNGAGSLKPLVFAPREPLLQIEWGGESGLRTEPRIPEPERVAVLGARACDLAALDIQDRIFLRGRYPDAQYAARRRGLLLIAVDCTRAASTCFCTSMDTGPAAGEGCDLALTELDAGFCARAVTPVGEALLEALQLEPTPPEVLRGARAAVEQCARSMPRRLDPRDLPELLYRNLESDRWDEVGARCLGCANCTLVCPTCFCHDERDEPALDGARSLRVRQWDSCFNRDHGQIHGFNHRPQIRDRYRQWLVHKLAGWVDQFGVSGCVGCGRCISWCPVGIDLCEEIEAIRAGEAAS